VDITYIILATLPFAIFCLLLFFNHTASLLKISLLTLVITIFIVLVFWRGSLQVTSFSLIRGLLISLDILFIIFGAILFLEVLKKINVTKSLAFHLDLFSPDLRIQVIILAWFLENFLEGIAGFGTPSTVVAPMLVALGLSPLSAVIIALLGNSVSVPFGAVGTPLRIGFSGINLNPALIAPSVSIYNLVGFLVPSFMLWVLVSTNSKKLSSFFEALPFAVWSGVAFVVPAYFISLFGIEFPSIIGSIIGLFLVLASTQIGLFVPKTIYHSPQNNLKPTELLSLTKTIFPYILFILILINSKLFLSNIALPLSAFSFSFNIFNPGLVFIFTSVVVARVYKLSLSSFLKTSIFAFKKTVEPFLVVAAMSSIVQLMNSSANSALQLLSITQTISILLDTKLLPFVAPFVGAFGSFITGSATISNLMFAPSLYSSSVAINFDPIKVLSLALVGAGAGNMVALSDVLAAKTVVGIDTSLRQIIIILAPYCLVYLILVALVGFFV
jgi:lactate permease